MLIHQLLSPYLAPEGEAATGTTTTAPAAAPPAPAARLLRRRLLPAGPVASPATSWPTTRWSSRRRRRSSPRADERKAFLGTKGVKPEDIAKLDDAGLKAKFEELKAADAKSEAIKGIEVKLPEGAVVDEAGMSAFKEIIADAKLSPSERAQKLVDLHAAQLQNVIEGPVKLWMDTQKEWQGKVKSDPELGGANFTTTEKHIATCLDKFVGAKGTPQRQAVDEAFTMTGAGNHPEIVRLLTRAGKMLSEGKHVAGGAPNASGGDVLNTMYPSMAKA
jgi:hypothetical protein